MCNKNCIRLLTILYRNMKARFNNINTHPLYELNRPFTINHLRVIKPCWGTDNISKQLEISNKSGMTTLHYHYNNEKPQKYTNLLKSYHLKQSSLIRYFNILLSVSYLPSLLRFERVGNSHHCLVDWADLPPWHSPRWPPPSPVPR